MTYVSVISRFIRRYFLSVEALILIVLIIILYNSAFHVKPIWRYLMRAKVKVQLKWNGADSELDYGNEQNQRKGKVSWEMKKDGASVYAIQGRRPHMEDRFNIVNNLEHTDTSIFGVFDGHGGEFAADFTEKTLFKCLMIRLLKASLDQTQGNMSKLLTEEILSVDKQFLELAHSNQDISGTTVLLAMLKHGLLTVANVGDSRGVLCDVNGHSIPLSYDHKPHLMKERKRIQESGGFVSFNGVWRVAGILATSRAIGDYPLKDRNLITAQPDILTFDLKGLKPKFMILATDGLWDCFSNQEAVDYIKERLHEPYFGAKSLVLQAYYRGSLDNISVMVVNFQSTQSQFYMTTSR
ncbi:hypothetical protein FSP39_002761 [Pinctada imbricata]|uniref:PPM-type phosphatase domain-containing protein n=1 Tax=Pinctada imbricata TaxID=66713 RepID=A0AA89BTX9_PINIB|nr:hypothetical protein FSP39_002761 [Pinctada imbricata]